MTPRGGSSTRSTRPTLRWMGVRHGRQFTYDEWGHVTQIAVGGVWSGDDDRLLVHQPRRGRHDHLRRKLLHRGVDGEPPRTAMMTTSRQTPMTRWGGWRR